MSVYCLEVWKVMMTLSSATRDHSVSGEVSVCMWAATQNKANWW